MTRHRAIRSALTALAFVLAAGTALAHGPVLLTTHGMTYKDASDSKKAVTKVGVDFVCSAGLTVRMTDKGLGALGDATVSSFYIDNLPKNALDQVDATEALARIGFFTTYPGGVAFRVDDTRHTAVLERMAKRLTAIGCDVSAPAPGSNAFAFRAGGEMLRAVFNSGEGGTTVYVGR